MNTFLFVLALALLCIGLFYIALLQAEDIESKPDLLVPDRDRWVLLGSLVGSIVSALGAIILTFVAVLS